MTEITSNLCRTSQIHGKKLPGYADEGARATRLRRAATRFCDGGEAGRRLSSFFDESAELRVAGFIIGGAQYRSRMDGRDHIRR